MTIRQKACHHCDIMKIFFHTFHILFKGKKNETKEKKTAYMFYSDAKFLVN